MQVSGRFSFAFYFNIVRANRNRAYWLVIALERAIYRIPGFNLYFRVRCVSCFVQKAIVMETSKKNMIQSLVVATMLPLFTGCVATTSDNVTVTDPPPPQVEVVPASPDPAYVWIGGS